LEKKKIRNKKISIQKSKQILKGKRKNKKEGEKKEREETHSSGFL